MVALNCTYGVFSNFVGKKNHDALSEVQSLKMEVTELVLGYRKIKLRLKGVSERLECLRSSLICKKKKKMITYIKKLRASDRLKTSAFFMQRGCKVVTRVQITKFCLS